MAYVFRGGIYIDENKRTLRCKIERPDVSDTLFVPFAGHSGVNATPIVSAGDRVLRGQLIGPPADELSCAVHSPVSGEVVSIHTQTRRGGTNALYAEIKNDGLYEDCTGISGIQKKLADCTLQEITEAMRRAGICDMDASGVPADVKTARAAGNVEYCIINCIESEPYVTCDYRLLIERPAAVVNGLKIFLRALGLRRGIIAVPDNKPDIARKLGDLIKDSKLVSVMVVRAKYPASGERELIYALTDRVLPVGADVASVGCVIYSPQTCAAVFDAFVTGMPLVSRIVTVSGDCVARPVNVEVPIGTKFSRLVEFADGIKGSPAVIIEGGPMTGRRCTLDDVVTKSTTALTVLSKRMTDRYEQPPVCINCGRCVTSCPMQLMPNYIYSSIRNGKIDDALRFGADACDGCGVCSYVCPGKAPVAELISDMKHKREAQR